MSDMIADIRTRLLGYAPNEVGIEGARARAAVLIPLYEKRGEMHVVLTKRTDRVHSHRGEISFPGGAMDPTDLDLMVTALRESNEEIGLRPDDVEIIGRVDDIITISDFHVTAFVGHIDPAVCPYLWRLQETEVAELIEVPVTHLLERANLVEVPRNRNGELVMLEGFQFGDHVIWGATGRMLRNFLDVAVEIVAASNVA